MEKAEVSISIGEVRRLFVKSVKGRDFTEKDMLYFFRIVANRVERDYPNLLETMYNSTSRRYQKRLAQEIRERNSGEMNE
jgi:hypothetical protein